MPLFTNNHAAIQSYFEICFYCLYIKISGKLTTDQIKAGYAALKKIDACIESGDLGHNLTLACDEFYTRIPHDFG